MQHVICTGNIGREQFNEFCALAPNVHVVRGDFDNDETLQFPEVQVIQVGEFRIGLIHGHQLLPSAASQDAKSRMRRKLDVDILVSGHTHKNEVVLEDGCYHINPVSGFLDERNWKLLRTQMVLLLEIHSWLVIFAILLYFDL